MMVKEDKREKQIIEEMGAQPSDELFVACNGFFIRTSIDSPLTSVQPGMLVKLTFGTAIALFLSGKVEPESIPEEGEYRALRNFSYESNNKIFSIENGDKLRLNKGEAINLLRERKVEPINDGIFFPWKK